MINPLTELVNLFYPNSCLLCRQPLVEGERFICLHCHCNIPKTNYHIHKGNPARDLFAGYSQVNEVTSYLFFEKDGATQKLIHTLKYKGNKELAAYLGRTAACELKTSGMYASIDTILPIPLHPKKEKRRGYNQSAWIAKGIASIYGCDIDTGRLKRTINTESQTLKPVYDRHVNVENIFFLTEPEYFFGKHVLLIDDVITTGATVSSCIDALLDVPEIQISIFSLAIAREY
jgi:ComF family protein